MAYTTLLSHVFLQDLFKLIYKKKKKTNDICITPILQL